MTRIPTMVLCIALLRVASATPVPQDEPAQPETGAAPKPAEKTAEKKIEGKRIAVHFTVSAEGKKKLPADSKIDLLGDENACKELERPQRSIGPDGATFTDLPVCKVKLRIYITGFDTKIVSVDLAHYKDPMRILVKSKGPPIVD